MGEWWSVLIVVRTLQGKDGEPVFLFVDGHSSRWPLRALRHLQDHNVFCIVLPSHTTIWSQPNDAGANASFKWVVGDVVNELGLSTEVHKSDAALNRRASNPAPTLSSCADC